MICQECGSKRVFKKINGNYYCKECKTEFKFSYIPEIAISVIIALLFLSMAISGWIALRDDCTPRKLENGDYFIGPGCPLPKGFDAINNNDFIKIG